MDVQILQILDRARDAKGLTVIIDVFRAFSTTCYAYEKDAAKIIPAGNIEKAYQLKKENPEFILMGERDEKKPTGFDFGNSPSLLSTANLSGRTIVHTTSSGTQGIEATLRADEIITGSFVNAAVIIQYIRSQNPETVSLVCMGYACKYPTDEDTLCAEYIKNELQGQDNDFARMKKIIRMGSGKRFFEPDNQEWAPSNDFELCLQRNIFDFVLKVENDGSNKYLQKVRVTE